MKNIKDGVLIYKLFDKRDAFPFYIVRTHELTGNVHEHVFYRSTSSEFFQIARATLLYEDFLKKSRDLVKRMLNQGASHSKISLCLKEDIQQRP